MNTDKILSMFDLVDEFQLIDFSPASTAKLNVTKTMLDKCIIDANAVSYTHLTLPTIYSV